jgi:mono/diheme cytochrome c family protein
MSQVAYTRVWRSGTDLSVWVGIALFSAVCSIGCNAPKAEREWTAADHGQPKQQDSEQVAPSEPDAPPPTAEEAQARAMAAVWKITCASCHGQDGRGGGAGLPPGARVPDFTDAAAMAGKTDEQLASAIRDGRGMLPGFGPQLGGDAGVNALVAYVKALSTER